MDAYPHLFAPRTFDAVTVKFEQTTTVNDALVSNVSIVPFIGDKIVVIVLDNGITELPGGTLEPDETYPQTIARELLEEAGAKANSYTVFGVWRCHSVAKAPYRPHLPHPDFLRVFVYADVELIGVPTNPEGGETVVHVETVTVEEAAQRFNAIDRAELAELCLLASALRERGKR